MNDKSFSEDPDESGMLPIEVQQQAHKELTAHVGTGKKLRVETRCSCNELLNGYLMGLSDELGLMHCFHDFMPDGYTVFRLTDVTGIRSNDCERFWDRMLSGEGLLGGLQRTMNIHLKSIGTAIESINLQFQKMIIEVEIPEEEDFKFYLGQVKSLNANGLEFDHFNSVGRWEHEPTLIPLSEISFLQFDTPYITKFCKYLDDSQPPHYG